MAVVVNNMGSWCGTIMALALSSKHSLWSLKPPKLKELKAV